MMTEHARKTLEVLRRQVSQSARAPFQEALAQALHGAPGADDWRDFGASKPHLWAQGVRTLAELSGYVQTQHVVSERYDASKVAVELVRRHGVEAAQRMLEAAGMPASLALQAAPEPVTVDSEAVPDDAPVQAPIDKESEHGD